VDDGEKLIGNDVGERGHGLALHLPRGAEGNHQYLRTVGDLAEIRTRHLQNTS
jgi:hypothetical protein